LQNNLDRMVLTRFGTAAEVGLYGAATRLLQLGTFPLQVATRITYPKFFHPDNEGLDRGTALARRIALPMLGLGIGGALFVMAAALAIPWILGLQYADSVPLVMILAWSLPFIALQTPPADALVAARLHAVRAAVQWGSALASALLLGAGAVLGGMTGLAIAYVVSHAAMAAVMWTMPGICARRARRAARKTTSAADEPAGASKPGIA
jgi:O-antigen/teichoic acid export membrane protein